MKTTTFYGEVVGDRARDERTLGMLYKEMFDRIRRNEYMPAVCYYPESIMYLDDI